MRSCASACIFRARKPLSTGSQIFRAVGTLEYPSECWRRTGGTRTSGRAYAAVGKTNNVSVREWEAAPQAERVEDLVVPEGRVRAR